ncbi:MAG: 4-vinyl reductase [Spirochaetales bacterium]|jgi:predicted hydrocarbon binding protein|nr:4-vinyl reductase [Spirochaetales bacterium]
MRKYAFSWDLIGNISDGRANLGASVDLEMYRLMQFTLRDILEQEFGEETTDKIFYKAGYMAGEFFFEQYIAPVSSVEEFVSKTQSILKEKKVGILRLEEADLANGKVLLTIDEDLDCSGLPEMDFETCVYDEGFVAALFKQFTSSEWKAKEIDCWCTGARTCRFLVTRE